MRAQHPVLSHPGKRKPSHDNVLSHTNATEHRDCHLHVPAGTHGTDDFAEICKSKAKYLKPASRLQQHLVVAQCDVGHSQSTNPAEH